MCPGWLYMYGMAPGLVLWSGPLVWSSGPLVPGPLFRFSLIPNIQYRTPGPPIPIPCHRATSRITHKALQSNFFSTHIRLQSNFYTYSARVNFHTALQSNFST